MKIFKGESNGSETYTITKQKNETGERIGGNQQGYCIVQSTQTQNGNGRES